MERLVFGHFFFFKVGSCCLRRKSRLLYGIGKNSSRFKRQGITWNFNPLCEMEDIVLLSQDLFMRSQCAIYGTEICPYNLRNVTVTRVKDFTINSE